MKSLKTIKSIDFNKYALDNALVIDDKKMSEFSFTESEKIAVIFINEFSLATENKNEKLNRIVDYAIEYKNTKCNDFNTFYVHNNDARCSFKIVLDNINTKKAHISTSTYSIEIVRELLKNDAKLASKCTLDEKLASKKKRCTVKCSIDDLYAVFTAVDNAVMKSIKK